jgi:L-iditol 2-dehydrogenase
MGRPQICRRPAWVLGGFAQLIAAPKVAMHRIPDGLPPEAAAMAEPLAAAVHAIARGSDAGDVGVLGGGSVGLMLAGLLVREGRSVLVADRHKQRRDQAVALGARAGDKLSRHKLIFEAVGRPEAWRIALSAAAPGGVVVFVGGCPAGTEISFPAAPIHYDELDLRGTFHHSPAEVDAALRVLAEDGFPWRLLLGERIGLERLQEALASASRGPARKFVVDPSA